MKTVPIIVLMCAVPVAGIAQALDALDVNGKLRYHAEKTYSPGAIAVSA